MGAHTTPPLIEFELTNGKRYRKTIEVLAFRSDHAFVFHKPWGRQILPAGSWLIVPADGDAQTGDIYGCHPDSFAETYRPSPSGRANAFQKFAEVLAYQPGKPFAVQTVINGTVEVHMYAASESDWLLLNASGEMYVVADAVFRVTYSVVEP
jgi:hypothetical protein